MFFLFEFSLVIVLGLCLGSFATALNYRIPLGLSWVKDPHSTMNRSKCPSCSHELGVFDLVPFFSWLRQGGRCRYCQKSIPVEYPLIELMTTVLCLVVFWRYGLTPSSIIIILTIPFFVALTTIDLRHYILPDQLLGIIFGFAVLFLFVDNFTNDYGPVELGKNMGASFISGLFYAGFIFLIGKVTSIVLKRSSLGFGDVKLYGVCGFWLGIQILPVFLIQCGLFGVVLGLIWQKVTKNKVFPFGPAIILAFFISLLFGDFILSKTNM